MAVFNILAVGQSNMGGSAAGGAAFNTANSRIKAWDVQNNTASTTPGGPYITPVQGTKPFNGLSYNNCALWFADGVADHIGGSDDVRLNLHWANGQRIDTMNETLTPTGLGVQVRNNWNAQGNPLNHVFLWWLGETDGQFDYETPSTWKTKFNTMISEFRSEGILAPWAPVIMMSIKYNLASEINGAQIELASEQPNHFYVDNLDLTYADGVHANGPSLVTCGERAAAVWINEAGAPLGPRAHTSRSRRAPTLATVNMFC